MRLSSALVFGLLATTLTTRADESPTAEEQQAIAAIAKLGGKAEIDPELPKEARVSVAFAALTDNQLALLKKHSRVGAVTTGDCRRASDRGLANLAALPNLRKLTLSQSMASNLTAKALAECPQLRMLYVGNARLTDDGLAFLKKLPRLEVLDVTGNAGITDKGMAHVAEMERLEQLYLAETRITDKGLETLRPLEGLTRLNVTGTKVTSTGAEKFEKEMPNLRAVRR